jgi:hypothetical protein
VLLALPLEPLEELLLPPDPAPEPLAELALLAPDPPLDPPESGPPKAPSPEPSSEASEPERVTCEPPHCTTTRATGNIATTDERTWIRMGGLRPDARSRLLVRDLCSARIVRMARPRAGCRPPGSSRPAAPPRRPTTPAGEAGDQLDRATPSWAA